MIASPKKITWKRYFHFVRSPYSLLRTLQYEFLQGLSLKGRVLDVGGLNNPSYAKIIIIDGSLDTINIDASLKPTFVHDLNLPIPIKDQQYDHVISFNTLEHIMNDELVLQEIYRILKPGGSITIVVPFLYRVHGANCDFHRKTAYWWQEKLTEIGFDHDKLFIEPLLWDDFSAGYALTEYWSPPRFPFPKLIRGFRRIAALFYGAIYHSISVRDRSARLSKEKALLIQDFALGYGIRGIKPI